MLLFRLLVVGVDNLYETDPLATPGGVGWAAYWLLGAFEVR
jgi:hypothetical protein